MFWTKKKENVASIPISSNTEYSKTNDHGSFDKLLILEYVAIPPGFDIISHLKMREKCGIFDNKKIDLKHLQIISDAVSVSPVFSILNNIKISISSCLFFLIVINELDLVIKNIHNPLRKSYENLLKNIRHEFDVSILQTLNCHMNTVFNFVIINLACVYNDDTINEVISKCNELYKEQEKYKESLKLLK